MKIDIKKYLSEIGRKGGKKSRRTLTRKQSLAMIKAREEKRGARK
jgi:general stress protein YciG